VETGPGGGGGRGRQPAPLRVDAQRNLAHVLRAAREVFGESGYGAPMEDVARRARVGVGTVYRRFSSKDLLVRRIAEEETARLTEQARTALGQEEEAWSALASFLRASAASGAGRLLPPQVLRVQSMPDCDPPYDTTEPTRVPQQRQRPAQGQPTGRVGMGGTARTEDTDGGKTAGNLGVAARQDRADEAPAESDSVHTLLDVVGRLVERARAAGELRCDVSVADVLLVIATAAPALPDAAQHAAVSARLLDILLDGLRFRPGVPVAEGMGHQLAGEEGTDDRGRTEPDDRSDQDRGQEGGQEGGQDRDDHRHADGSDGDARDIPDAGGARGESGE